MAHSCLPWHFPVIVPHWSKCQPRAPPVFQHILHPEPHSPCSDGTPTQAYDLDLSWPRLIQSDQISHSVMSNSLGPHGLQHARPPCPSATPGACSNSCPLSQWCHPTISSSVILFSSCLQSFQHQSLFRVFYLICRWDSPAAWSVSPPWRPEVALPSLSSRIPGVSRAVSCLPLSLLGSGVGSTWHLMAA